MKSVANFLLSVGKCVREEIEKYDTTSRLFVNTNAISIRKFYVPSATTSQSSTSSKSQPSSSEASPPQPSSPQSPSPVPLSPIEDDKKNNHIWKIQLMKGGVETSIFATHVMLSTGGHQESPDLNCKAYNNKIMLSDHLLSGGLTELQEKIKKWNKTNTNCNKIVIVGGSHSAFSCAWLMLKKLEQFNNPSEQTTYSIIILHRSFIKVFYSTKREADSDNYSDIGQINKITGQIHPFEGLRGDAKGLYKDIRSGKESRVRLIQIKQGANQSLQKKLFDESPVIIWATGYSTNSIPIFDDDNNRIDISLNKGQMELDESANILMERESCNAEPPSYSSSSKIPPLSPISIKESRRTSSNNTNNDNNKILEPIGQVYGSGLGYGLRTTLGVHGRADGVAVYLKRQATLILGIIKI